MLQINMKSKININAGPAVWNSLPASVQASTNTTSFCRLLKTHLLDLAFTQ